MSSAAPPSQPEPRLRTPPQQGQPPAVGSSPVKHVPKYHLASQRDQVQSFALKDDLTKVFTEGTYLGLTDILNVRVAIPSPAPQDVLAQFSMNGFCKAANLIAESIKTNHFSNNDDVGLLVFEETESSTPLGHITDTSCRPDITAAFQEHWWSEERKKKDGTKKIIKWTFWPCIRLAGERASGGKSEKEQLKQAASYLHYLLLARPDLHVAQGLLTRSDEIVFIWGIGGVGMWKFGVKWDEETLYTLLYRFIYRLYQPGDLADPSYTNMKFDLTRTTATYTVSLTLPPERDGQERKLECHNFYQLYASNPWDTRTHVLSNPHSDVKIDGKELTVLKDQLCRDGTRFQEYAILSHIHELGTVPGVVVNVHNEKFTTRFYKDRSKHRLGFQQSGLPFSGISTPKEMLEAAFDVLEVLRYLHAHRQVLHRDISKGNVLSLGLPSSIAWPELVDDVAEKEVVATEDSSVSEAVVEETAMNVESEASSRSVFAKTVEEFCFVKHLLDESEHPHKTSTLLIDFNRSERLDSKLEDTRMTRTGTPLFIARAVELGRPVPHPLGFATVAAVPACPAYALKHPDRLNKFPPSGRFALDPEDATGNASTWRHDLEHDAESVFWLVLYWVMVAQPAEHSTERITSEAWTQLLSPAIHRNNLITTLTLHSLPGLTHRVYEPLGPLINKLAGILAIDRQWLPESDVRNDPEYVCEAFQRLILQFLLDNCGKAFMTHPIGPKSRAVEDTPHSDGLTSTAAERHDAATRKRPSPLPSRKSASKRIRSANEADNVRTQIDVDADPEDEMAE